VLSAACTPVAGSQPTRPGPDVTIGIPLSATGSSVLEAGLTKQGYDLWLDWANRNGGINLQGVMHRVHLLYENDNSDPLISAQVTQQMITQKKVQFMLGPYGTTNTAAVAAVADKYRVPLVASNAAARQIFTQGFRYVFGVLASADQYPQALIDMVLTMNPKPATVAIVTADDLFSQSGAKATADYAVSRGLKIVFSQTYPSGLTNFDALIQQAKARNPDMLFNLGHLLESVAVNKAAMDVQLNAKLFAYAIGPAEPEFVGALGKAADYVVTVSPWTAEAKYRASYYLSSAQYVATYRKKFHTSLEPSFAVADATAAGVALQAAIEQARSLDRDKVRDALASLDVATFFGRIRFDAQGENSYRSTLVVQIQNGQQLTVWPPELASAMPAYPTPTWSARLGLPATPPKAKLPGTGQPPAGG
jgi:branched-chain amino acid transport system substrate-binding protein